MTKGLISMEFDSEKIQIILRKFPSISSILHGFDIGSCAVAFTGKITLLTTFSMYSILNRVNLVVPRYSSPSYAYRLDKYFRRGFALGFVDMKDNVLKGEVKLPSFVIQVTEGLDTHPGMIATGRLENVMNQKWNLNLGFALIIFVVIFNNF